MWIQSGKSDYGWSLGTGGSVGYDLTVQDVGDGVYLSWTDVAPEGSGYSIERSTDAVNFAEIDTVARGISEYLDTTVSLNTQYWYRVRAIL